MGHIVRKTYVKGTLSKGSKKSLGRVGAWGYRGSKGLAHQGSTSGTRDLQNLCFPSGKEGFPASGAFPAPSQSD